MIWNKRLEMCSSLLIESGRLPLLLANTRPKVTGVLFKYLSQECQSLEFEIAKEEDNQTFLELPHLE